MKKKISTLEVKKVIKSFEKNYKLVPLEVFGVDPYKTLISTLMSSRTNDDTTLTAANKLFEKAPNIQKLSKLSESTIRKLIFPVGFYKVKAKHIKKLAKNLVKLTKGEVPKTREELMSLPGVGRKTANLVLNRAFKIPAIAVDTHVHRISNMLGWVDTVSPNQTEVGLVEILDKKYWAKVNILFVSIGRQFRTEKKLREFLKKENLL